MDGTELDGVIMRVHLGTEPPARLESRGSAHDVVERLTSGLSSRSRLFPQSRSSYYLLVFHCRSSSMASLNSVESQRYVIYCELR